MGRQCEITEKGTMFGNNVPRKGLARRKGGGGQHIGVKTRRTMKANLLDKRFFVPSLGIFVRIRVSARALRSISKLGLEVFLAKNGKSLADFI